MTDELVPADWQTRSLAFLIDLIIYIAIFYGLAAVSHFWAVFLSMIYIVFRDGLFAGQSVGKKVLALKVVHSDGRDISFVDSAFRNVLFLFYVVFPATILLETIVLFRSDERLRLGDRIARTRVVRKAVVPALA